MSKHVKLHWTCNLYIGPAKWHGTERFEPDECGHEFSTTESIDEVEHGLPSAICPKCSGTLNMFDDEPRIEEL